MSGASGSPPQRTGRETVSDPRRAGSLGRLREQAAGAFRWAWVDEVRRDVVHGARALRRAPALSAVVMVRDGQPARIASAEKPTLRGDVIWCAGPWRTSGEWWSEQVWSREEWDIAVHNEEGVTVYRVYRDEIADWWRIEGTYD